jgi:hypothetical protein
MKTGPVRVSDDVAATSDLKVVPRIFEYDYCVLQYRHDPASGEALNIGTVLYARNAGFLRVRLQTGYARLSAAFPEFDSEQYLKVINRFERSIERSSQSIAQAVSPDTLPLLDTPLDLHAILHSVWEDRGLSYQFGPILPGASDDLSDSLNALYDRYVRSQQEAPKRVRREDQDVWTGTYRDALRREHVAEHLVEHTFKIDDFDYKFDYTFQNGTRHALKPVTLDYADKSGIRERVDRVLGEAKALSTRQDLGMIYLLLGKPRNPEYMSTYQSARKLLDSIDIKHQIVEEEQAEEFGRELAERMRAYGILP